LGNLKQIKHLDLFDNEYWNGIQKGEILAIEAKIRIPASIFQLEQAQGLTPLADFVQKYGISVVKDSDLTMFQGMTDFRKLIEDKPIPLLFQTVSTPGFSFAADLSREYITGNLTDFQGEGTVFGKVQRILSKGQKMEIFSLIPDMQAMPNLTRQQRLALKSNKNKKAKGNLSETLVGPAIVLTPLAVYR